MDVYDYMIESKRKDIDALMEKDVIYKTLVHNYAKASIPDRKGNVDNEHLVEALNALAMYTNKLQDDARLALIKSLNIADEDLSDMFKNQIIDNKTMSGICEYMIKKKSE